jgi:hypothetical protein
MGLLPTKNGGASRPVINGWGVRIDNISQEVFIAPRNVESGIGRFVETLHHITHGDTSILGSALQGPVDNVSWEEGKEWSEGFEVRFRFGQVG